MNPRINGWLLLLLLGALALSTLNDQLGSIDGDNAQYIFLAQSIATGHGYRALNEPGAPPEIYFPFLFPLMLSPIVARWGIHAYLPMHGIVAACGIGVLLLWLRWVQGESEGWMAPASLLLLGTSPLWMVFLNRIVTEIPYLLWTLAAFLLARRYARQDRAVTWTGAGLAAALAAAYFTRTVGIVLIAAVLIWLGQAVRPGQGRRATAVHGSTGSPRTATGHVARRRLLFLTLAVGLPIAAWHLRNLWMTHGHPQLTYWKLFPLIDPYQPDLGIIGWRSFLARVAGNVSYYLKAIPHSLLFPLRWADPSVVSLVGLMLGILVGIGLLVRVIASKKVLIASLGPDDLYFLLYAGVFACWNFQEPRFLVPVLPWLSLYLLGGIARILSPFTLRKPLSISGRTEWSHIFLIVLLACNLIGVGFTAMSDRLGLRYNSNAREWLAALEWIKTHSPPGAVVMARKPTIVALLTGRQSMGYPLTSRRQVVLDLLQQGRVSYIVHEDSPEANRYLAPVIRENLQRFDPEVVIFGKTRILRVRLSPA